MTTSPIAPNDTGPDAWDGKAVERQAPADALAVEVDGYAGPLDLLLALARTQKVDLSHISVLALAEQYLAYIATAERLQLEVAADYLVMAAWLAFLKSRLLLPRETTADGEPTAEALAQRLAFRLMRLEAMRDAAARLMTRHRLGHDVFARGQPEDAVTVRETQHTATIYDLLKAYAVQRTRTIKRVHVVKARTVWSIKDARQRLERLIGESVGHWVELSAHIARYLPGLAAAPEREPETGRTVVASSFGATLEMARDGVIELRQSEPFAPIYVRRRGDAAWERMS